MTACSGSHASYSRSRPRWQIEKQITAVKFKENLSYPEARRKVTAQTPIPGVSYVSALTETPAKKANKTQNPENSFESDSIQSEPIPTKQSKHHKKKRKSQNSLALMLSKRCLPPEELPSKLKKSLLQNSVALGLANQGNAYKDLTSLFGGAPKSLVRLSLHPSEEEERYFVYSINCSY
ncbi:hypothetical protein AVEN_270925-1 [Araneus ventricosus]|uniref:Uncharacterized protein n=1 Tax=Araneus ventricosus TaxID=182803 RepID=A0A4Y2RAA0_ARAVE|nr:hypothetical protein AVEN_270925-1 [Araneus ventricosus]